MAETRPQPEPWLSADEIARHLGISKETVYRWVRHDELPAHRIGRLLKFKLSDVDAWVLGRGSTGPSNL
jgi:excisionase family DNA binding protein